MVSLIDQKLGEIIALLEKQGELDNTWIVYSSDHGDMLGDHLVMGKFVFQFPSVGVPGIIRPPKAKPKIGVVSEPVGSFDLNPTMLDIAGLPALPNTLARSLLPLMEGKAGRGVVFSEVSDDDDDIPAFVAVSDGKERLTLDARNRAPVEFCDLVNDPDEGDNLVKDPARQKRISDMRNDLILPFLENKIG